MLRVPNRRSTRLVIALLVTLASGCHAPVVPLLEAPIADSAVTVATLSKVPAIASAEAWFDCNLEHIDSQAFAAEPTRVAPGADFKVAGFMLDRKRQSVPSEVRLRLVSDTGQAFDALVTGRVRRPDIPGYFKLGPWSEETGVEQVVSSGGLLPGAYHLLLVARVGSATVVCDNGRRITLAGSVPATNVPKESR